MWYAAVVVWSMLSWDTAILSDALSPHTSLLKCQERLEVMNKNIDKVFGPHWIRVEEGCKAHDVWVKLLGRDPWKDNESPGEQSL